MPGEVAQRLDTDAPRADFQEAVVDLQGNKTKIVIIAKSSTVCYFSTF